MIIYMLPNVYMTIARALCNKTEAHREWNLSNNKNPFQLVCVCVCGLAVFLLQCHYFLLALVSNHSLRL